ncbi:MAG: acyl-CoA reductase [Bacteroidia bacterium]|nr:acyl-CoA reductase [Bacteroidia bacterium]
MTPNKAIESLHQLGEEMRSYLAQTTSVAGIDKTTASGIKEQWEYALRHAEQENGWFTRENILNALTNISGWLNRDALSQWIEPYRIPRHNPNPLSVGIIMAGNIPLVGFHDLISILATGNKAIVKFSHSDRVLMEFLLNKLKAMGLAWSEWATNDGNGEASFDRMAFPGMDAVIATGSDNSAKHFEYYFRNKPHIIRRSRNSAAVLDGTEKDEELQKLGTDIFSYFGLGCRNVSKLYVPEGYDFKAFFRNMERFGSVINNHKYANNYLYNRTIYLMNGSRFTDNNFLLVIEDSSLASPCATLHFEYYKNEDALAGLLLAEKDKLQCIACGNRIKDNLMKLNTGFSGGIFAGFGKTQSPALNDYADGVDVIAFLNQIQAHSLIKTISGNL